MFVAKSNVVFIIVSLVHTWVTIKIATVFVRTETLFEPAHEIMVLIT